MVSRVALVLPMMRWGRASATSSANSAMLMIALGNQSPSVRADVPAAATREGVEDIIPALRCQKMMRTIQISGISAENTRTQG